MLSAIEEDSVTTQKRSARTPRQPPPYSSSLAFAVATRTAPDIASSNVDGATIAAADSSTTGLAATAVMGGFVEEAWELCTKWNELKTPRARVDVLHQALNAELAVLKVPVFELELVSDKTILGVFDPKKWTMRLDQTGLEETTQSTEYIARLARTLIHETRHSEQHYRIARLISGEAGETASAKQRAEAIKKKMGLTDDIAEKAALDPLTGDGPEVGEAKTWYESIYGSQGAERSKLIDDLNAAGKDLEEKKTIAENLHAMELDKTPSMRQFQANAYWRAAREKYLKLYAPYRALPEEKDANDVGDTFQWMMLYKDDIVDGSVA